MLIALKEKPLKPKDIVDKFGDISILEVEREGKIFYDVDGTWKLVGQKYDSKIPASNLEKDMVEKTKTALDLQDKDIGSIQKGRIEYHFKSNKARKVGGA